MFAMVYYMKIFSAMFCLVAVLTSNGAAAVGEACTADGECEAGEICDSAACAATDITQTVGNDVTVTTALGVITNKEGTTTLTLKEDYATTITTFTLSSPEFGSSTTWSSDNTNVAVFNAGAVTIVSADTLDFETDPVVTAVLTAIDSTPTTPITATVSLTLSLTDVNDNTPIFSPATYTDRVANGATEGTVATTVTATDADRTAPNNDIAYSITGGNDPADWKIDATTGVISVAVGKTMASATTLSYTLTVTATDSGAAPETRTVTVVISVATACTSDTQCNSDSEDCSTVNSANVCKCKTGYTDNAGTCDATAVACTVDGECATGEICDSDTCAVTDITQTVGTDVTVTTALGVITDKEGTTTLTLKEDYAPTITTFTLSSPKFGSSITWNSDNTNVAVSNAGAVTIVSADTLDFETEPVVTAVLTAIDSTPTTPITATVSLTLSLTDVNDNTPIFSPATYTDRVANGATEGTVATTVTATDADRTAPNNDIAYSITGGNDPADWKIDATTGVISVAVGKTMASATTLSYTLTVTATDSGAAPETRTVTVVISVATACTSDTQCNSDSEDCSTVNSANVCKCKTGYTDNAGTCDATAVACTADGECATGEICDSDTCAVTDITQTVGTDVTVSTALGVITDKEGTTTLTLKEDYAPTITTFTLSSPKFGSSITWNSDNTNVAVSNAGAVTIVSADTLDFETEPVVTAVLMAIDSTPTTPITATVSLTLSLTDVNDNTPIFSPATYTDRVANGATEGTVATTVTATDADGTAPNNVITYSITGVNTGVVWEIDTTTGVISVAVSITIGSTPSSYSLEVTATDSGSTPKSAAVTVVITVATACTSNSDCNTVSEECNTANGANVCVCKAGYVDNSGTCQADCPSVPTQQNGVIGAGLNSVGSTRTVTCDSDYTLTGLATITCQTDSTWETPGTCNAACTADGDCATGEICDSDTCAVTDITQTVGTDVTVSTALGVITDKEGTTTLTLKEDYAPTITTFTLSSPKFGSSITWNSDNSNVAVSNAGAVTIASAYTLDFETEPVVTAVLTAIDSTPTTPITATVSLTLNLTDVNDNTPIFSPATYTDRVANGATEGTVATTVTATDADGTAPNNVITYSITGGNDPAHWKIDATTGVISIAVGTTMASATTLSYTLTVTATDSGAAPETQTVTVIISVATVCTSDTQCNSDSEDCSTVNSANVCKCKTGYTDNAGTCEARQQVDGYMENACTADAGCTSANNEACTIITGSTKACRCKADYTDNGGTCLSDCPSVPTQQNGEIGTGTNSVGSNRTVTCDSGYALTGLATITCQTDSTWETPGTCNGAVSMLAGMILISLSSLVAMVIYI